MEEVSATAVKGAPKMKHPKIYLLGNKIDLVEKDIDVRCLRTTFSRAATQSNQPALADTIDKNVVFVCVRIMSILIR